jgi:hypothetical protein
LHTIYSRLAQAPSEVQRRVTVAKGAEPGLSGRAATV